MKIRLSELPDFDSVIEQIILNSFESSIYLVDIKVKGSLYQLTDEAGRPQIFRSQLAAKKPFKGLGVRETLLHHQSPYGEMIGLDQAQVKPMMLRISNPDEDFS